MMMDLQGFKTINDRLGHPWAIPSSSRRRKVIRDSLRMVDAGCRYGGDEFVAVLPNTTLMGSLAVAERIRQRVAKIQLPRRIGLTMGLHYGVATFPSDGRTSDFLIRPATSGSTTAGLQLGPAHAAASALRGAGPGPAPGQRAAWRGSASSR